MTSPQELPRRTVSVFALKCENRTTSRRPDQDWVSLFRTQAERPQKERKFEGMYFEHRLERGMPVLCIHKPLSGTFMRHLDDEDDELHDVDPEASDVSRFLHSTIITFMNGGAAIGVARAQLGGPQQGALVRYLGDLLPLEENRTWTTHPIKRESDTEKFKNNAQTVSRIKARVTAQADLFTPTEQAANGMFSYLDRLSTSLGSQIEVKLDIKVKSDSTEVKRAFKKMVQEDLARLTNAALEPPEVTGEVDREERQFYLTDHPLASTVEITSDRLGSGHFSALIAAVVDESLALQEETRKYL